jgi:outer membrane biosynthesis protein TonB
MRVPRFAKYGAPTLVVALAFGGFGSSAAFADDAVPTSATSASTATTSPEAPVAEAPAQAAPVSVPAQPAAPDTQPAAATPSAAPEVPAPAASEAAAPAVPDKAAPAPSKEPVTAKETTVPKTALATRGGNHGGTPPTCTFSVDLSHTYDDTANSGTVTATGEFCGRTYFVSPTAWAYTNGDSIWPQDLVSTNIIAITKPGTYPFSAPVTCGQGDIYGGWDKAVVPTQHLTGESVEFNEHFLHFDSTGPVTWMKQSTDCYAPPAPPKEPVAGTVSFTDTQCLADQPVGNSLTIAGEGKTTSTVSVNGSAPKAASNGTFTDELLGINGYPATLVITLIGEDGSTKVFDHKYTQPTTAEECAPVVATPPTGTIHAICTATNPQVNGELKGGSEDATVQLFINREQAAEYVVKAGETKSVSYRLDEDTTQGKAIATFKFEGGSISDLITFTTDCVKNTPKPTPTPTPSDTPTPNPTPTHHDTPQPTPSTAPVAVQHHTPTGGNTGTLAFTGANVGAPITAAIVLLLSGIMLITPVRRRIFGSFVKQTNSNQQS